MLQYEIILLGDRGIYVCVNHLANVALDSAESGIKPTTESQVQRPNHYAVDRSRQANCDTACAMNHLWSVATAWSQ